MKMIHIVLLVAAVAGYVYRGEITTFINNLQSNFNNRAYDTKKNSNKAVERIGGMVTPVLP